MSTPADEFISKMKPKPADMAAARKLHAIISDKKKMPVLERVMNMLQDLMVGTMKDATKYTTPEEFELVKEFVVLGELCFPGACEKHNITLYPEDYPPEYRCPECGRVKARSIEDVSAGLCPKWWAIRDPEAEADCRRLVKLQGQTLGEPG